MNPVRVGVVGCGVISGIYFQNLLKFGAVDVVACSDLIPELSQAAADAHAGIQAMTTDKIFADSSIDLVLNLTQPKYLLEGGACYGAQVLRRASTFMARSR